MHIVAGPIHQAADNDGGGGGKDRRETRSAVDGVFVMGDGRSAVGRRGAERDSELAIARRHAHYHWRFRRCSWRGRRAGRGRAGADHADGTDLHIVAGAVGECRAAASR